jgi:hypothetical protein
MRSDESYLLTVARAVRELKIAPKMLKQMILRGAGPKAIALNDPVSFVVSANLLRRHLSAEQKRHLIAQVLKLQPETSDRQIGKMIKADH